ncbi:MAG: hypothetical protein GF364_08755 [Candidatus Lokiarchaeota archaeon]|nr:hypothetical protein [Candidatus Lokiarchaeota archaeon]
MLGTLILYLNHPSKVSISQVAITGIATTFAIGISGYIGAYVSEKAESRLSQIEIDKAMLMERVEIKGADNNEHEEKEEDKKNSQISQPPAEEEHLAELEQALILRNSDKKLKMLALEYPYPFIEEDEVESLIEDAEKFSNFILAVTEGISPAIGSIFGLIPFFFGVINMTVFIISFLIEFVILFTLGYFLGKVSQEGKIKYGLMMVLAGFLTAIIPLLFRR